MKDNTMKYFEFNCHDRVCIMLNKINSVEWLDFSTRVIPIWRLEIETARKVHLIEFDNAEESLHVYANLLIELDKL